LERHSAKGGTACERALSSRRALRLHFFLFCYFCFLVVAQSMLTCREALHLNVSGLPEEQDDRGTDFIFSSVTMCLATAATEGLRPQSLLTQLRSGISCTFYRYFKTNRISQSQTPLTESRVQSFSNGVTSNSSSGASILSMDLFASG